MLCWTDKDIYVNAERVQQWTYHRRELSFQLCARLPPGFKQPGTKTKYQCCFAMVFAIEASEKANYGKPEARRITHFTAIRMRLEYDKNWNIRDDLADSMSDKLDLDMSKTGIPLCSRKISRFEGFKNRRSSHDEYYSPSSCDSSTMGVS